MDEAWKINYPVDRRDVWLDEYFTYFYHPWVRCVMVMWPIAMCYAFVHRLVLTHNLATAALSLLPTDTAFWLVLVVGFLRIWNRIPSTGNTRKCSATIDAQRFYCVEPQKAYRFPWKKVMSIPQTLEYTLFFTWNGGTFTIPNRAFGTFEEAQHFYQTALLLKQAAKLAQMAPIAREGEVWPPAPRPCNSAEPGDGPEC